MMSFRFAERMVGTTKKMAEVICVCAKARVNIIASILVTVFGVKLGRTEIENLWGWVCVW